MQSSSTHIDEDHDHSADVEVMAESLEVSISLNEDMNTQKTNFEDQELYHEAGDQEETKTEDYEAKTEDYEEKTEDYEATTEDYEAKAEDYEEETEDEEEFSFTFDGSNESLIAAEDAFIDGKIKPLFPLFNQDLLLQDQYFEENLSHNPKVKKVLFEMNNDSTGSDEISGPYCEWKGKPSTSSETEHERCKKSNSTGFSKLWRLKEVVNRSNSDGRDAFVFLKGGKDGDKMIRGGKNKTTPSNHQNGVSLRRKEVKKMVGGGGGGGGGGEEVVVKGGKINTASLSAHEIYLKNKAKENDRKKVYKPEVFGFFTNVNGGITKNVHPY